ncbi:MAG: alanine--tRNA ligase [Gammaproteobacteria bacterium GWE2_37_16]|nr:MAG: alanine--tRNA ligase [Gammaproteobacteria bacterium GWE2_37_16]
MQSSAIRTKFLEYFEKNGHTIIPSSSLVPVNDPTLLFTNAGMVQFKDVFLGKEQLRDKNGEIVTRAVTCQRCLRAGGKHNDLENVGYTTRHHTFFEMLGNFSFGDYFKKEAIHYAWDFLTNELGIPSERLLVTVHEKDKEAEKLWGEEFSKSNKHPQSAIIHCGDKDNFWSMGDTGPCGYCSEIFYDHDPDGKLGLKGGKPGAPDEGGERYVEIWNLVFMQFYRDNKSNLTPLPKPSVDTGMGLERIAAVMQRKSPESKSTEICNIKNEIWSGNISEEYDLNSESPSNLEIYDNYDIDIFKKLIDNFNAIVSADSDEKIQRKIKNNNSNDFIIAKRIVVDHIRSAVFLIADGLLPSNEGRGYVLRSIIRRAIYYLYKVGLYRNRFFPYFAPMSGTVIALMGGMPHQAINAKDCINVYPELELEAKADNIRSIIANEEKPFVETLERGEKILNQELDNLEKKGIKIIPGVIAFNLHDTYGFPIVLTMEIAKKRDFMVDLIEFEAEMEKQRERSRAASKFGVTKGFSGTYGGVTEFVGYEKTTCNTNIHMLFSTDQTLPAKPGTSSAAPENNLQENEHGIVILNQTPFYAESGGQVGDIGKISFNENCCFIVSNTTKYGTLYLHHGKMTKGSFSIGNHVKAEINEENRTAIKLNHSSAHLLHRALQEVLGDHATQRGSLVDAKKLRFDFAHFSALTTEELHKIESIVNAQIRANLIVKTTIMSLEEAKKAGAVALFGEKYGDKVRVVKMGDFSSELCGGTHVNQTGEIGILQITSESGVASGIRRIEAITGANALEWITQNTTELKKAAELLNTNIDQVCVKLQHGFTEKRALEKELTQIKTALASNKGNDLVSQAQKIGGINVLAAKIENVDSKTLRQTLDTLKEKLQPAVVFLATVNADKIQLVAGVSKDICAKFKANELLQYVAKQVDGTGGGRPDMAQGGGTNVANLDMALQSVAGYVNKIAI